jgi:hypothetical protein
MSESAAKIRDKRVKPRFKIQVHARIKAQLIGSSSKFPFVTLNISESGVLLTEASAYTEDDITPALPVDRNKKAPSATAPRHAFNTHSILEVWLYNDRNEEIFFFAKYVRKADDHSFAIRIIDIDATNARKYQEFIEAHRDSEVSSKDDESTPS